VLVDAFPEVSGSMTPPITLVGLLRLEYRSLPPLLSNFPLDLGVFLLQKQTKLIFCQNVVNKKTERVLASSLC
jgi:hypothetical protein